MNQNTFGGRARSARVHWGSLNAPSSLVSSTEQTSTST